MLRLQENHNPLGLEFIHERIRNLGGQPLLELKALGIDLQGPGNLAEPYHLAVGDIGDRRRPVKGEHVVFTEGIEGDVLLHHQVVVVHMEPLLQMPGRVVGVAAGQLLIHPRDPVRSLQKSLPGYILPDSLENQPDALLNQFMIHGRSLP